jgi:hypothetical protein
MKTFILDSLQLVFENHLELSQDYDEEQASRITRHSDGSARKQTAWRGKIKTTLNGSGWIPPGLEALNYSASMEMSCIALKSVTSASNVITLPAARRADAGYEPFAIAHVNGGRVDTVINSLVANVATVEDVNAATHYTVFYYPKITVFASVPQQRHDVMTDTYTWSLEAREA